MVHRLEKNNHKSKAPSKLNITLKEAHQEPAAVVFKFTKEEFFT
jgi:hypothetical protein